MNIYNTATRNHVDLGVSEGHENKRDKRRIIPCYAHTLKKTTIVHGPLARYLIYHLGKEAGFIWKRMRG